MKCNTILLMVVWQKQWLACFEQLRSKVDYRTRAGGKHFGAHFGLTWTVFTLNVSNQPIQATCQDEQMISFKAIDLWKSIPQNLKDSNVYTFSKNIKNFLLSEQFVSWNKELSLHLSNIPLLYSTFQRLLFLTMFYVSALFCFPRLY